MRKLIAFAGTCLLAACLGQTEPTPAVLVLGTASPTSIQAKQTVTIDLTVYNNGSRPVDVGINECPPPYEILNSAGTVVGPASRACTLSLSAPQTIPGQGSIQYSTTWTGDSLGIGAADGWTYLKPGSYTIRPRVNVLGDNGGYRYGAAIPVTITP
jgi:hypothetical protein